jgi:hypothetical protein
MTAIDKFVDSGASERQLMVRADIQQAAIRKWLP